MPNRYRDYDHTVATVDRLRPHPANPRTHEGDLTELVASIRQDGVIQPLVCCRPPWSDSNILWVVAGSRRLAAARRAGLGQVPVMISRTDISDEDAATMALAENMARKSLNPIEEAQAFADAIDRYDLTQSQLAERVGCSQGLVSKRLRLLELTETQQQLVAAGVKSVNYAEANWLNKDPRLSKEGRGPRNYPEDRAPPGSKSGGASAGERGTRVEDHRGYGDLPGRDPNAARVDRRGRVKVPGVPKVAWRTAKKCALELNMPVEGWLSSAIREKARRQLEMTEEQETG